MSASRKSFGAAIVGAVVVLAGATSSATTLNVEICDYNTQALAYLKNNYIPAFEKAHPGVSVSIIASQWSTLLENLTGWYATGNLPDVMQVGAQYIGLLAPQGMILPLDPFTANWADLGDFPPVTIQDATYQGHVYDIPYSLDLRGFVYRKDLFSTAGLDPNAPPTTWDALAATAKKLTRTDENGKFTQSGFTVDDDDQLYASFLLQAGGHYLSTDLKQVQISSPQAIQAMQFESDLVNQYHVSPPDGFGGVDSTSQPAAMSYTGGWAIASPVPGTDIAAALPPAGPGGQSGAIWIDKWVMGSQTKNAQLAWDWIKGLSQPDVLAEISRLAELTPPRFSMLRYEPWSAGSNWKTFYDTAGLTAPFRAQVPVTNDFIHSGAKLFTQAIDDVLHNRKSPSVAFAEVQSVEQAKLDAFWQQMKG